MSKLDGALLLLQNLPTEKQDIAADALLDFVAQNNLRLSAEQAAEVERRMRDVDAPVLSLDDFRARVRKLIA